MTFRRKIPKVSRSTKLEDILGEELRREMFLDSGSKFRYIDDWENLMHSVYELPIEYDGYENEISELHYLKEIIDILTKGKFDEVKRSESRKKYKGKSIASIMYYNIIFIQRESKVGYGTLIYLTQINKESPQRSKGIVLVAKIETSGQNAGVKFEKAKFNDFLVEVRPYVELIGDLYREIRKP